MGFGAASLQSMRSGWGLPTDDECRIAKPYGGIGQDSNDDGKVAHKALPAGGDSGFNGLLGEDRSEDGHYAQLEVQGFYWTASESGPDRAFSTTLTGAGKLCIARLKVKSNGLFRPVRLRLKAAFARERLASRGCADTPGTAAAIYEPNRDICGWIRVSIAWFWAEGARERPELVKGGAVYFAPPMTSAGGRVPRAFTRASAEPRPGMIPCSILLSWALDGRQSPVSSD